MFFKHERMKLSTNIILFNSDQSEVLLVKRRDMPVWVLPGGGVDAGETPAQAAIREALEETGYTVSIKRKIAEYLPVNKMTRPTHVYEGMIVSGSTCKGAETADIGYFSVHDLPKLMPPTYKCWVADALLNRSKVIRKKVEKATYLHLLKLFVRHPIIIFRFLLTKFGIHINRYTESQQQ